MHTWLFPTQNIRPFVSDVILNKLPPSLQWLWRNLPVDTLAIFNSPLVSPVYINRWILCVKKLNALSYEAIHTNIKLLLPALNVQQTSWERFGSQMILRQMLSGIFQTRKDPSRDELTIRSLSIDQSKPKMKKLYKQWHTIFF